MERNRLRLRSLYPVQADAETDVRATRWRRGDPGWLRTRAPPAAGPRIRCSGSCYGAATAASGCCCSLWGWEPSCPPPTACPNTGCCSRAARWAAKEQKERVNHTAFMLLNPGMETLKGLRYKDEPSQTHLIDFSQPTERARHTPEAQHENNSNKKQHKRVFREKSELWFYHW